MSPFLERMKERVLVFDGAMGTALQGMELGATAPLDAEPPETESCPELLNLTRPEVVAQVHESFYRVGCDAVETNTFGANRVVLAEHGLADRTEAINLEGARLAARVRDRWQRAGVPRFVVGSMGPGSRLPSLGQIDFHTLVHAYREQAAALVRGGADALLVETCQDILQTRAAVVGAFEAFEAFETVDPVPVMAQVTLESRGTMLMGTDIAAVVAILSRYDLAALGVNCATGPEEMAEHVAYLVRHSPFPVSVLPNAGIPESVDGEIHYPLTPEAFGRWMERFALEDGVSVVGGCCGTTPAHLSEAVARVGGRPPLSRRPRHKPALASLFGAVPLEQEADVLTIGERTNANGSQAFRRRLAAEDWDGIVQMGRTQIDRGAHAIDVCTAVVGRDEGADMDAVVSRFRTEVPAPLVVDSTDPEVVERALALCGGRCIVNSVNLERGSEAAAAICRLAARYGAAVVALLIDEEGMARTPQRKVEVATRLYRLILEEGRDGGGRLRPSDILFDPLTFSVATGNEADRPLARWTLEAIRELRRRFPESGVVLGVSNVSYGLAPRTRPLVNAVFLHHARQAGLTAAIVHARGVRPLHALPDEIRIAAEDLVLDRRAPEAGTETDPPLDRFMRLTSGAADPLVTRTEDPELPVEDRLTARVVEGRRDGLEQDLEEALEAHAAEAILQDYLLGGMKRVGDLFARGETQLPFVLRSAETMKAAVALLKPHLPRRESTSRGTLVLATVRGDVHDIGKNLVDILLTNNGFRVVNLGIKQPVSSIIRACREHEVDAVGMSGLLVESTRIMRENLREMRRQGIRVPVILGGAALTRSFVEGECSEAYGRPVTYARDAFDGLTFLEGLETARGQGGAPVPEPAREKVVPDPPVQAPPPRSQRPLPPHARFDHPPRVLEEVPTPPFFGVRTVDEVDPDRLVPLLNKELLFRFQWGFARRNLTAEAHRRLLEETAAPLLEEMRERARRESFLTPRLVYGYFPCHGDGDRLRIYDPEGGQVVAEIPYPRQPGPGGVAIPDFFRPVGGPEDVVALFAVTVGSAASRAALRALAEDAYRDYLLMHGLSAEMAEALAEFAHRRIREELGIAGADARERRALLRGGYRGRRYAFGYPACPDLAPQRDLLRLLRADRIGIVMDPDGQLVPEQSTAAVVVHHPEARYFRAVP